MFVIIKNAIRNRKLENGERTDVVYGLFIDFYTR